MLPLILGAILEFTGPIILALAKFILGASLLDGIGGSYSNTATQEAILTVGIFMTLVGSVLAPFCIVKFFKPRISPGGRAVLGLAVFIIPWASYFIVAALPS